MRTASVVANGPIAVERGNWTFDFKPGKGAPPGMGAMTDQGKYLTHWHDVGGQWLMAEDIWNSDTPAAPPPPARPARTGEMIEIRRLIGLRAAPETVWEILWDVPALARCIPGCGDVTTVDDGKRYRATIRDRVGPFTITVPLDVGVDAEPPGALTVHASGRDSALGSPISVTMSVTLRQVDGGTELALGGRAEVGGKLATLGQGVMQRKTRDILDLHLEWRSPSRVVVSADLFNATGSDAITLINTNIGDQNPDDPTSVFAATRLRAAPRR